MMTSPRLPLLGVLAFALAGCGAQASQGTASKSAPDLSTPERALEALTDAEGQLSAILGPAPAKAGRVEAEKAGDAPAPMHEETRRDGERKPAAPPPAAPMTADEWGADKAVKKEAPGASPCVTACAALASMSRAADHLCELAGESDGRCSGARERVKSATSRVQASCPVCR